MYKAILFVLAIVIGLAIFIWASDRITLEGERTVYTVKCEQGAWDGLHCTGRIVAGDRHRFRTSRSRKEVVYWIAGSPLPSGKFTECQITDRDDWLCQPRAGEIPSITHEMSEGRPTGNLEGTDTPFRAVNKWKWWALNLGLPLFSNADFSSHMNPRARKAASPSPSPTAEEKRK